MLGKAGGSDIQSRVKGEKGKSVTDLIEYFLLFSTQQHN